MIKVRALVTLISTLAAVGTRDPGEVFEVPEDQVGHLVEAGAVALVDAKEEPPEPDTAQALREAAEKAAAKPQAAQQNNKRNGR